MFDNPQNPVPSQKLLGGFLAGRLACGQFVGFPDEIEDLRQGTGNIEVVVKGPAELFVRFPGTSLGPRFSGPRQFGPGPFVLRRSPACVLEPLAAQQRARFLSASSMSPRS